jgi:hypothetical protein
LVFLLFPFQIIFDGETRAPSLFQLSFLFFLLDVIKNSKLALAVQELEKFILVWLRADHGVSPVNLSRFCDHFFIVIDDR